MLITSWTMQRVNEERDLGVIMSKDMKWEKQCIAAVKKMNRVLGMIKRNLIDRSKETMYKSMVRPHLQYCIPMWSPYLIKDIKLIEGVRRRATKLVEGIGNWSYDERLKYLGLTGIDTRRVRSDLLETFKIMNGLYDVNTKMFFKLDVSGRRGI